MLDEKKEKTESWLSKRKEGGQQHRVTKSTFTASSSSKHADVSVDDPDFWRKVKWTKEGTFSLA